MYRRILVLLDGSTQAEQAIPLAARIARVTRGTVIFVNTALSFVMAHAGSAETLLAQAEDYLAYHISAAYSHELTGISIERTVVMGADTSTILAVAQCEEADLLVVCNYKDREHQGPGAIIWETIRRSSLPTLVVQESDIDQPESLDGAVRRIIVPLDGSPEAEAALEPAAQLITALASPFPAELQLLYVAQKFFLTRSSRAYSKIDAFVDEETRREAASYLKLLERRLSSLPGDQLHITFSIMQCLSMTRAIVEGAERTEQIERTGTMLAMTPCWRRSIVQSSRGGVLERVLEYIRLPVLIIRSHLYEARMQPEQSEEIPIRMDDMDGEEDFAWCPPSWSMCLPNTYGIVS